MAKIIGLSKTLVSTTVMAIYIVLSVLSHAFGWNRIMVQNLDTLTLQEVVLRLALNSAIWMNVGQALVGSVMLFSFRTIERQMGSKKFERFSIFVIFFSSLMMLAAKPFIANFNITAGPIPLIFALLFLYYVSVPVLQQKMIILMSLGFSNKFFIYLLALQLLFSDGMGSIIPALAGLVSGVLYLRILRIQRIRFPTVIQYLLSGYSLARRQRSVQVDTSRNRAENTAPRARIGPLLPLVQSDISQTRARMRGQRSLPNFINDDY